MIEPPILFSNLFSVTRNICFATLPLLRYANNLFTEEDWETARPIRLRAIGSRTDDKTEVMRRLALIVAFAKKRAEPPMVKTAETKRYANRSAAMAAAYTADPTKDLSQVTGLCAAQWAALYAAVASEYAEYATNRATWYITTRDDLINLFDQCFPPADEPQPAQIDRAKQLIKESP